MRAALQFKSVCDHPCPPLNHRCLGLFSSFEMTHIFTLCLPPAALPLPWPVPKGSSAHGCQVSCILLKKHGTDVQGPKTMLDSSKQTCTCSHSERHGCIVQAQQLIWTANWTTSPVVYLPKSAWLLYPCWGGFLGPVVSAQHRKADLTLWLTHLPHDNPNANDKIKLWWSLLISKIIQSSLSRHCFKQYVFSRL